MCTSLPDDKPLNRYFTAGAGQIRPTKYVQQIFVAAPAIGNRIKIAFTGSQGRAEIIQALF